MQIEEDWITYIHSHMQIGDQRRSISEWARLSDEKVAQDLPITDRHMDRIRSRRFRAESDEALHTQERHQRGLAFWRKYKAFIFQTIETCPAEPTQIKQAA